MNRFSTVIFALILVLKRFTVNNAQQSDIVIFQGNNYTRFLEVPEINLKEYGTLHMFTVGRNFRVLGETDSKPVAIMKTRMYCWGPNATYNESEVDCGIPGPIWIMTPDNSLQQVVLHNELIGIGNHRTTGAPVQLYKDMDIVCCLQHSFFHLCYFASFVSLLVLSCLLT